MSASTQAEPGPTVSAADRTFRWFNGVVSVGALAFLAWLLLLRSNPSSAPSSLAFLPAFNASMNAVAAVLLVGAWIAIRQKRRRLHAFLTVSAFIASAVFLVSYVIYHGVAGSTPYPPDAALRWLYYGVLLTHVVLSMFVLPLALSAFWMAYRQRFQTHRRITRVLAPLWLYVSVTGVVIFAMLRAAGA